MTEKTVLAIDPGSSKCGLALVRRLNPGNLDLLWHEVIPTETLLPKLVEAERVASFQLIIVGGGTTSRRVLSEIREHYPGTGTLVVDETNTTIEARERYWEHHPRRGWRRFWPATLQVPPEPVDDFAAMILAERVLLER